VIALATGITAATLSASPTLVTITGAAERTIRVSNWGDAAVAVTAAPAGFALDRRGRPRVVPRLGSAGTWLELRPRRLVLGARRTAAVDVSARTPADASPGDHAALVLLTTLARRGATVAVRMQIGVVVIVRVPGRLVHALELRGLTTLRRGGARVLVVALVNRGNVAERLRRIRVLLQRRGRVLARLYAPAQTVLPHARAVAELRYRGGARGWATAVVDVGGLHRVFRLRL
jgi:hypothetical protein